MTDVIKFTKTAFTWSVVALTILWSVGLASLAPVAANAASCPSLEAGDLVKFGTMPAVYVIDENMAIHWFDHGLVFRSWGYSSADVNTVDASCGDDYDFADTYPGRGYSYGLVKTPVKSTVYFVSLDGSIYTVPSEAAAVALFGANWASLVRDVVPEFAINYGSFNDLAGELSADMLPEESLVSYNDEYWVYRDGALYPVEGELNAYLMERVTEGTDDLLAGVEVMSTSVPASSALNVLRMFDAEAGSGSGDNGDDTPAVAGALAVGLSANTPDAGNVVVNIDNVVFTKVVLTAGDADVTVNSFQIGRDGLGSTSDISSVTVYHGDTKLGNTKTSWSSDDYMTYNVSGGWTIPAGETVELTIVAKVASGATGTYNALGIEAVNTAGSVTVSGLPVFGNEMTGVSVTVGTVTITNTGTSATKNIGTTDTTLGEFKLAINSIEGGSFERITLRNKAASSNASDGDVANLYLTHGGNVIAGPAQMKSDKVTFVLDEAFDIAKSKNETFRVVGDVVDGSGNTLEFVVDADTDLVVVGAGYGTNLTVTRSAYDQAGEGAIITIAGAELNVAYTGTATDTVDDRTDVEFGRLTISSGATDVKITNLVLDVDETAASGDNAVLDVDDLELVDADSGAAYSGTETGGGDGTTTQEVWTYTDEMYLEAGKTYTFIIRGDVPTGVTSTAAYTVSMDDTSSDITAETVPAGDAISNFSIGSFTGKAVTVRNASVTVRGTALNAGNAVVNDSDVVLYKATVEATADDVTVTRAVFDGNAASQFDIANWTQVGLYTVGASGEYVLQKMITNSQMTSSTNNPLDYALDLTIAKGEKVTIVARGTVASTLTSNTTAKIHLDYLTVKDSDNDDATVTGVLGSEDYSTDGGNDETTGMRTITLASEGILYISMRNTDTGFNKDRIVLAGSDFWAGKLFLKADYEDIVIEDLKLTNSDANAEDSIEEVCLYTAQSAVAENEVACTIMDGSDVVFFNDINYTVEQGSENLYVYVRTNPMGDAATATADNHDKIQLAITTSTSGYLVVKGVDSGATFSFGGADGSAAAAGEYVFDYDLDESWNESGNDDRTASTTLFVVSGSRISNIQFVSSDPENNETVDTVLSGTGEYTAAILAITNEDSTNASSSGTGLKLGIDALRFDFDKYESTTINSVTLERIGGSQGTTSIATSTLDDNTVTSGSITTSTLVSTWGVDAYVDPGTTAYFVLKVNVNAVNTGDNIINWFRFDMDDLKGTYNTDTDNNVDWYADAVDAETLFNAVLLDTTKLTGTKVAELG